MSGGIYRVKYCGDNKLMSKKGKKVENKAKDITNIQIDRRASGKKLEKSIKIDLTPAKNGGKNKKFGQIVEKFGWKKIVISAVALVVLIAGGIGVGTFVASRNETDVADTTVESEPEPEEPKEPELPTENTDPLQPEPSMSNWADYQVAAYKPRFMSIPSLGLINLPIIEIGTSASNQLGAPVNNQLIGWYYRSSLPGQPGVAMMDGHGGDLGDGILRSLPKIQEGAEIIIEMGDGRKFTYHVTDRIYKKLGQEANSYMKYAYDSPVPGAPALTIITCTGTWLRDKQTYDLRLFVKAVIR